MGTRLADLARWNARLHYYLGLYFLFFIWLFAITGLLLNHGTWGMESTRRSRATATSSHRVFLPNTGDALGHARDLMRQLQIEGEIQWLGTPPNANRFDFRAVRPGFQADVKVDLAQATAVVERTTVNALGAARNLHVFTGVRLNDPRNERDWILTRLWSFSMDALAAGLLIMVASGLWMWLQASRRRVPGTIALAAGVICCAWFIAGVAWFGN